MIVTKMQMTQISDDTAKALGLLTEGKTLLQAAAEMGVSYSTVKDQLITRGFYKKIGAKNMFQAGVALGMVLQQKIDKDASTQAHAVAFNAKETLAS